MILSDREIKELIDNPTSGLIVNPFDLECLQGASYDLKVGQNVLISGQESITDLTIAGAITIQPGDFAVVVSNEYFEIPQNMVINIGAKTYLTKKGIILQAGMQIDPGFKGYLFLGLYNSSPRKFILEYKGDLCSIQFFQLRVDAKKVFNINYDYLHGNFPKDMKDYLYSLENNSLSNLAEDLRTLTKSVSELSTQIIVQAKTSSNQADDIRTLTKSINELSIKITEQTTFSAAEFDKIRSSLKHYSNIVFFVYIPLIIMFLILFLQK
jgi:deoxycytidine triphosphate deaminase